MIVSRFFWCASFRGRTARHRPDWLARAPSTDYHLVDDVIAAIDIKCFSGDKPCGIVGQEGSCHTHVLDADKTTRRRLGFRLVKQGVKFRNARGGARRKRPWRDSVHPN